VVIGNGNVAVDVARMLALTPDELAPTDTTDPAIAAIGSSPIREIVMLGRRGPAQASFTTPELQELGELAGADVIVDPAELELDPASEAALEHDTNARRNLEVLREYAARKPEGKPRSIRLRFLVSPVAILGEGRVEAVEIVRNRLEAGRAVATDERETIPAGLVFRSVGYRGVALAGVPFDESTGTIANDRGRALGEDARPLPGVYCAGWIKRGPTGVIGTNKKDASETAELLLEDARAGRLERGAATADEVDAFLDERGVRRVLYPGWTAIDELERSRGEPLGRPRVKLATWNELLDAAESIAHESR
jgi:ferredoxin--NADP+ reductase